MRVKINKFLDWFIDYSITNVININICFYLISAINGIIRCYEYSIVAVIITIFSFLLFSGLNLKLLFYIKKYCSKSSDKKKESK